MYQFKYAAKVSHIAQGTNNQAEIVSLKLKNKIFVIKNAQSSTISSRAVNNHFFQKNIGVHITFRNICIKQISSPRLNQKLVTTRYLIPEAMIITQSIDQTTGNTHCGGLSLDLFSFWYHQQFRGPEPSVGFGIFPYYDFIFIFLQFSTIKYVININQYLYLNHISQYQIQESLTLKITKKPLMQIFLQEPQLQEKNTSKTSKIIKGISKLWNFCFKSPPAQQFRCNCSHNNHNQHHCWIDSLQPKEESILKDKITKDDIGPFTDGNILSIYERNQEKTNGKIIDFQITKQDNKVLIDLRQANRSARNYRNGFNTYTPFFDRATKQRSLNRQPLKKQDPINIKTYSTPYKNHLQQKLVQNISTDRTIQKRQRAQLLRRRYYKILQNQQQQTRMCKYRSDNTHKPITINLNRYSTSITQIKSKYGRILMQRMKETPQYPYICSELSSVSQVSQQQCEQDSNLYEQIKHNQLAIKTQKKKMLIFPREQRNMKQLMQRQYVSPLVSLYISKQKQQKQQNVQEKILKTIKKEDKQEQKIKRQLKNTTNDNNNKDPTNKVHIQTKDGINNEQNKSQTTKCIPQSTQTTNPNINIKIDKQSIVNTETNTHTNNNNTAKSQDNKNVPKLNPFLSSTNNKLNLKDVIQGKYTNNNSSPFNNSNPTNNIFFSSSNSNPNPNTKPNVISIMGYNNNINCNNNINPNINNIIFTNNTNINNTTKNDLNIGTNYQYSTQYPQQPYRNPMYNQQSVNLQQQTFNNYQLNQCQSNFLANASTKQAMAMFSVEPTSHPQDSTLFQSIFNFQGRQKTAKKTSRNKKSSQTRIC